MKKSVRFLAFAVLATSVFALAGCEDEHVHVDANHDGTCDTCQSMIEKDHVHTYEDVYSYDETNHWYASTCFHNVKSGVGAHDADEFGVCKVCGHKVGTPDVSTVAKALALATKQAGLVNGGTVETYTKAYSEYTQFGSFDKGEDYLHTLNYYGFWSGWYGDEFSWTIQENWWSVLNDTTVGFYRQNDEIVWNNDEFEQEAVNGWYFDGNAFANIDKSYGVEDMLNMLYSAGSVGAMEGTWVDNGVVDGVYSFSFDYYHNDSSDDISTISVSFTLNEDCVVDSAVVKAERYYTDIEEGATLPVKPTDVDADETVVYTITQRTGAPATPAINPEEVLLSSFELYNGNEKVEDEITVDCGVQTTLNLGDLLPESASDLTFEGFAFTGEDESTGEAIDISFWGDFVGAYSTSEKTVSLTMSKLGTYEVTISSRAASKTITVNVVKPATTALNITVDGNVATAKSMYIGKSFAFAVEANEYADNAHTLEFTVADGSVLTKDDLIYSEDTGLYVFTPDEVGTYVITATSTVNDQLTAQLTLTVSEAPSMSDILSGTYYVDTTVKNPNSYYGEITAVFTPDATPAEGYTHSGTVVVTTTSPYMDGGTHTYTYNDTEGFVCNLGAQYTIGVGLDADLNVWAVYNGFDVDILEKQASEGGDEGDDDQTVVATMVLGPNTITITDTYTYVDSYTFVAEQAGTYTFAVPAGIGALANDYEYVNYFDNKEGTEFSVELEANEAFTVYFQATAKGDYEVTVSNNAEETPVAKSFTVSGATDTTYDGTYNYTIDGSTVSVTDENGEAVSNIVFVQNRGYWYVTLGDATEPSALYNQRGMSVMELGGTLTVNDETMNILYTFTFA